MSPITSLVFAALGCAIAIAVRSAQRTRANVAAGLAAAAAAIAALRLADVALGRNTGFDQWLFHSVLADHGMLTTVGMAPRTAICFLGLGIGIVSFVKEGLIRPQVGHWAVVGAIVMALMATFAHFYEALGFDQMTGFPPMAVETSILVPVAGVGALALRTDLGVVGILTAPNMGGVMARQLFGAAIILPSTLGLICLHLMRQAGVDTADGVGVLAILTGLPLAIAVLVTASRLERTAEALTERTRELEMARKEAESANRAKSEFLANMSHELRTPLNAVIGFSEIMRDAKFGPLSERYREYSADIFNSGTHLLAVVNQILDLAKIEAGQLRLDESDIAFGRLASGCMTLVQEKALRNGISLSLDLAPVLPPLRGDETRIRQILLNLLSNAVKFTERGGSVTLSARIDPDGAFEFAIADTGIGMTETDLVTAFLPFHQIESNLARRHEGTGLGLPLARTLAEQHGGTLTLESKPGVGTTARLRLPPGRVLGQVGRESPLMVAS